MGALPSGIVQTCVTSPPYWGLRDYGTDDQLGLEDSPEAYVENLVKVFRAVHRLLAEDGILWLNLGDSYATGTTRMRKQSKNPGVGANHPRAQNGVGRVGTPDGLKTKDLIGIPWRVAFALQADGWYLRQDIIWSKPNPMPESVMDRCTKSHEYIFLLSKSAKYYYDGEAIKEPVAAASVSRLGQKNLANQRGSDRVPGKDNGNMKAVGDGETRNKRSVWTVATKPYKEAHFATYPADLIRPCILAGSAKGDTVLDPFMGSGTTAFVSKELGRRAIGCELNPEYIEIAKRRLAQEVLPL
ncbi:MAG: site-specific DNA-methyltransferase [Planctomycetes bacterium]|nr:site-specific DNA-methyltransferase [Planctomycetota bacterium]